MFLSRLNSQCLIIGIYSTKDIFNEIINTVKTIQRMPSVFQMVNKLVNLLVCPEYPVLLVGHVTQGDQVVPMDHGYLEVLLNPDDKVNLLVNMIHHHMFSSISVPDWLRII